MSWETSNKNTCGGKKVFHSWKAAQTHENMVKTKGSSLRKQGKKIEHLHPYKCLNCGQFHLGHPAPRSHPRLSDSRQREAYRRSDKRLYLP